MSEGKSPPKEESGSEPPLKEDEEGEGEGNHHPRERRERRSEPPLHREVEGIHVNHNNNVYTLLKSTREQVLFCEQEPSQKQS